MAEIKFNKDQQIFFREALIRNVCDAYSLANLREEPWDVIRDTVLGWAHDNRHADWDSYQRLLELSAGCKPGELGFLKGTDEEGAR